MQHPAVRVDLIEFQPAGFRDTEAMPEHQKQQAAVAGFVAAASGRLDQPFHLASGQVLPVTVMVRRRAVFPGFLRLSHFVESSWGWGAEGREGGCDLRFATAEALN